MQLNHHHRHGYRLPYICRSQYIWGSLILFLLLPVSTLDYLRRGVGEHVRTLHTHARAQQLARKEISCQGWL